MGDIFRRNALNLGLQVVQSPEAVADAHDGDAFTLDIVSRRLMNITQGKTYETLPVYADLLPASDGTAPFAIHTFNQITGGNAIYPRQAAIANDHFVFTGREDDERQTSIGRAFAKEQRLEKPYYAT